MTKQNENKHDTKLDNYESDLEKHAGQAKPLSENEKALHINKLQQAAQNYTKKDKRISIRVYGADLDLIKQSALREGLPYQTLITSVLHKYATGQLRENER